MSEDIESPILELLSHLGMRSASVNITTKEGEEPRIEVRGAPRMSRGKVLALQFFLQEFLKIRVTFRHQ
jgi:hypothetical protein